VAVEQAQGVGKLARREVSLDLGEVVAVLVARQRRVNRRRRVPVVSGIGGRARLGSGALMRLAQQVVRLVQEEGLLELFLLGAERGRPRVRPPARRTDVGRVRRVSGVRGVGACGVGGGAGPGGGAPVRLAEQVMRLVQEEGLLELFLLGAERGLPRAGPPARRAGPGLLDCLGVAWWSWSWSRDIGRPSSACAILVCANRSSLRRGLSLMICPCRPVAA